MYFDHSRPRIDPVVCVNAITLFSSTGRQRELATTEDWVYSVLVNRAYVDGTLYYHTPEAFLYFLSRLTKASRHARLRFTSLMRERVLELIGSPGDSLALAMRILVCAEVQVKNNVDVRRLLSQQRLDGSWDGFFYRYGSADILIGNSGLTTALAVKALQEMDLSKDLAQCSTVGGYTTEGMIIGSVRVPGIFNIWFRQIFSRTVSWLYFFPVASPHHEQVSLLEKLA